MVSFSYTVLYLAAMKHKLSEAGQSLRAWISPEFCVISYQFTKQKTAWKQHSYVPGRTALAKCGLRSLRCTRS